MKITNLSAEPLGKLHSWVPHDLDAEQVVFLPDACPGKSPLWVYSSYEFVERFYFGWRSSSSGGGNAAFTGQPRKLVRWGNAGLALITTDDNMGFGPSGLFLFDGNAVNPNAPPDVASGTVGAPCVGETGACSQF